MRNVMQRLLSADKGVYVVKGLKDDMISFTAGSKYFLQDPQFMRIQESLLAANPFLLPRVSRIY